MEARYRAAGDGDEQEREQATGEHWPATVDEARGRWHLQIRHNDVDTQR